MPPQKMWFSSSLCGCWPEGNNPLRFWDAKRTHRASTQSVEPRPAAFRLKLSPIHRWTEQAFYLWKITIIYGKINYKWLLVTRCCYNWWLTYPSEKYMTSSVGMVTFPTEWKVIKTMFQTINQITIELQTTNQITIELQFPSVSCNLSFFLTLKKTSSFRVSCRVPAYEKWRFLFVPWHPGTLAPWSSHQ